jgi:TRAP-type uncharacterized transport system substrate-binding protein
MASDLPPGSTGSAGPAAPEPWLRRGGWLLLAAAVLALVLGIVLNGPPHSLVIATGPTGSYFDRTAQLYAARLRQEGVRAELLPTEGALDNLQRINADRTRVDVAFTHGGMTDATASPGLVSLGSVAYEPLWVFYRKPLGTLTTLGQLKGLRLVLGPAGSGANFLSRKLLLAAGLDARNATLLEADVGEARRMLAGGQADAAFFMDPPETPYIHDMFTLDGVAVMNMVQAEGLRRNLPFLHVLSIPRAAVDLVRSQPPDDIQVVATTVVVVARRQVHPALAYLLMSIIDAVHEPPTLLQSENEFPADKDVDLPLSDQAEHYYKDGKPFLQRYLPFWLASLVQRLLTVLVPLFAVLVPLVNVLPRMLQWRIQRKITRCYQRLMLLERRVSREPRQGLQQEFQQLAELVDGYLHDKSIPASDVYILKEHIELVRSKMAAAAVADGAAAGGFSTPPSSGSPGS